MLCRNKHIVPASSDLKARCRVKFIFKKKSINNLPLCRVSHSFSFMLVFGDIFLTRLSDFLTRIMDCACTDCSMTPLQMTFRFFVVLVAIAAKQGSTEQLGITEM